MLEFGVINEAQHDTLKAKPLGAAKQEGGGGANARYFTEYIRRILIQKYGLRAVQRGGLTVYTTLDPHLQRVAEDSLETFMQQLETESGYENTRAAYLDSVEAGADIKPDYLQSSAVAIDPRNGHIKAWVGGRNFDESEWDRVYQAKKQPGSAFKVFIYITALEQGYSPSDILLDTPLVVEMPDGDVYKPRNFSKKFHGAVSLRYALNESINIPSIKLYQKIGGPSVVSTAKRMGIRSTLMPYLSLALGSYEVTLLEMTSAFGVLANGGVRAEPLAILRVEDRNGNILEEFREHHEEILSPDVTYIATDMLRSALEEGTGKTAKWLGFRMTGAGKTGTTDDFGDGWFIGFTRDLVVGVWTGFDEERFMGTNKTGARVALPIWVDIMRAAHPTGTAPDFDRPPNIAEAIVCEETGLLATPYCERVRREIYIEGLEPTRHCDLHRVSPYDLLNTDKDFRDLDKEASREEEIPNR
jgi:membrane carboxypeptidase/penicillin-binding protein